MHPCVVRTQVIRPPVVRTLVVVAARVEAPSSAERAINSIILAGGERARIPTTRARDASDRSCVPVARNRTSTVCSSSEWHFQRGNHRFIIIIVESPIGSL